MVEETLSGVDSRKVASMLSDAAALKDIDTNRGVLGTTGFPFRDVGEPTEIKVDPRGNVIIKPTSFNSPIIFSEESFENLVLIEDVTSRNQNRQILIYGSNNVVRIGKTKAFSSFVRIIGDQNLFYSSESTTINDASFIMASSKKSILMGYDCMLSNQITMRVSDSHGIFDLQSKKIVNEAQSILLSPHVWIAERVAIMKGVTIGAGAIVGAGSTVTHPVPSRTLAVGTPARVIRAGVSWTRSTEPTEHAIDLVMNLLDGHPTSEAERPAD